MGAMRSGVVASAVAAVIGVATACGGGGDASSDGTSSGSNGDGGASSSSGSGSSSGVSSGSSSGGTSDGGAAQAFDPCSAAISGACTLATIAMIDRLYLDGGLLYIKTGAGVGAAHDILYSVPVTGGTLTTVSDVTQFIEDVAFDAEYRYESRSSEGLQRISRATGEKKRLDNGNGSVGSIFVRGQDVFYDGVMVRRVPRAGDTAPVIVGGEGFATGNLIEDDDEMFVTANNVLRTLPYAGGALQPIPGIDDNIFGAFYPDASGIYFFDNNDIKRIDRATHAVTTIPLGLSSLRQMTGDGTNLYVSQLDAIYRVAEPSGAGGKSEFFRATKRRFDVIVVDATYVFVKSGNDILRIPK